MTTKEIYGWIDSHGGLWTSHYKMELQWGDDVPFEDFSAAKAAGAVEVDGESTYLVAVGNEMAASKAAYYALRDAGRVKDEYRCGDGAHSCGTWCRHAWPVNPADAAATAAAAAFLRRRGAEWNRFLNGVP